MDPKKNETPTKKEKEKQRHDPFRRVAAVLPKYEIS